MRANRDQELQAQHDQMELEHGKELKAQYDQLELAHEQEMNQMMRKMS